MIIEFDLVKFEKKKKSRQYNVLSNWTFAYQVVITSINVMTRPKRTKRHQVEDEANKCDREPATEIE